MSLTTSATRVVVKVRTRAVGAVTGRQEEPGSRDAATVVDVAVVAYRGLPGQRVRLDPVEEEGWARAVFGPTWGDAAYSGNRQSVEDGVRVAVFTLFLTATAGPTRAPAVWGRPLLPLRPPTDPWPRQRLQR